MYRRERFLVAAGSLADHIFAKAYFVLPVIILETNCLSGIV